MGSLNTLTFTRPTTLKAASRAILQQFLTPYRSFFSSRRVNLGDLEDPDNEAVFDAITQTFLSPREDTPPNLIDAVFCVSELAAPGAIEALYRAAKRAELDLPEHATPIDIAMRLYLADPVAAHQLHLERIPLRARAFEYFSATSPEPVEFDPPSANTLKGIERSLNPWFKKRRMGIGCRVFSFSRSHETWFLIRHGDRYRREAAVAEDGGAASVLFRPEKFDIVVYDALTDEIRINAKTPVLRERYRKTFSLELFGVENRFPKTSKYTLDPIRSDGAACVECVEVPGLQWIRLVKIEYVLSDLETEVRSHKSEDVFNSMACREFEIPPHARLLQATFKVRFVGSPCPRSVTIKPKNVALYTRDDDSRLIEEWLVRRGFTEQGMVSGHEQQELLLAIS